MRGRGQYPTDVLQDLGRTIMHKLDLAGLDHTEAPQRERLAFHRGELAMATALVGDRVKQDDRPELPRDARVALGERLVALRLEVAAELKRWKREAETRT